MLTLACGMPSKSNLDYAESRSQSLDPQSQVDFNMLKTEILAPKCLSCHSQAASENGIKNWVTPGDPESSALFKMTENGTMPKNGNPLSTRDLELIKLYITQMGGATPTPSPSPAPTPQPTPDPDPGTNPGVTFAEIKNQVLDPYRCTSCHSVGTEARLAKWLSTTNGANSRFYTITKSGTMPQGGSNVSAEDQAFILQYVKDYAARN